MSTFQLEFHLPFFALRQAPQSDASPPRVQGKRLRDWEELTLLTRDKAGPEGQEYHRLHKAQISCVVHGFDEWQWTAYAFEDTQHDREDDSDEGNNSELDGEGPIFYEEDEDPISYHLGKDKPIWRPRQYFLKAFEMQIRKFREEWDELVHKLEVDRSEYVCSITVQFRTAFSL
jgi:hypothetical protein